LNQVLDTSLVIGTLGAFANLRKLVDDFSSGAIAIQEVAGTLDLYFIDSAAPTATALMKKSIILETTKSETVVQIMSNVAIQGTDGVKILTRYVSAAG